MFDEVPFYFYPDHLRLAEPSDGNVRSLRRFYLSGKLINENRLSLRATVAGLRPGEFPVLHVLDGETAEKLVGRTGLYVGGVAQSVHREMQVNRARDTGLACER